MKWHRRSGNSPDVIDQRRARGSVDPDSFTHGTSAQRARWFNTGRESGQSAACDTFSPDDA